ncbi:DUF5685 family protein [Streptomyces sp. NPDC056600]|uniref:DUF5685 family protein n=1 Tax=Streptomyces sp. NPDC056600 TaxID=3345874 RepID=UPI0036C302A8
MFGMVRPCRHRLGERLAAEWTAHLCGLCLALRGEHGQFARVVTNYDGLLISVLTEAQAERADGGRRTAGPCPLRGMRTASVARGEGARLAAAVSLVLASAKVRDHMADGDGLLARRPVALAARRVAANWTAAGSRTATTVGFDTAVLLDAVDRQAGLERLAGPGTPILTVTEPTETATAAAFAHTAVLAGRSANVAPLAEAGGLFGRLAHLLDAVEDQAADAASGAWNPLTATGTSREDARRLADDAVRGVRLALRDAEFTDGRLVHRLLAHELERSVDRAFGTPSCAHPGTGHAAEGYGPPQGPYGPGPQAPQGPYGPRSPQGPYGPQSPQGPYGPYTPPGPQGPHGPGTPAGGQPPHRPGRGFWAGCAAAVGLLCTCRVCCADEFEGPWSGRRREGCCGQCDGNCCECCNCCSCCGGDSGGDGGGCDGCGCDCNC